MTHIRQSLVFNLFLFISVLLSSSAGMVHSLLFSYIKELPMTGDLQSLILKTFPIPDLENVVTDVTELSPGKSFEFKYTDTKLGFRYFGKYVFKPISSTMFLVSYENNFIENEMLLSKDKDLLKISGTIETSLPIPKKLLEKILDEKLKQFDQLS